MCVVALLVGLLAPRFANWYVGGDAAGLRLPFLSIAFASDLRVHTDIEFPIH